MRHLLLAALLSACNAQIEPVDLTASVDRTLGCGDVEIILSSDDATSAIRVSTTGLIAQAHTLEDVLRADFPIPHADVTVEWLEGAALDQLACGEGALIDRVLPATDGLVSLNVTPQGDRTKSIPDARVDVLLEHLLFEDAESVAELPLLDVDVLVRTPLR